MTLLYTFGSFEFLEIQKYLITLQYHNTRRIIQTCVEGIPRQISGIFKTAYTADWVCGLGKVCPSAGRYYFAEAISEFDLSIF